MRVIVRPLLEPHREIDLTQRLVAAIAEEISGMCGGNDQLNWIEAESHLRQIINQAKREDMSEVDPLSQRMRSMHGAAMEPDRARLAMSATGRHAETRIAHGAAQHESHHA